MTAALPIVVDPEVAFRDAHRISPSQIETYRLCPRKWAFGKLENLPAPPNKYAERGLNVHHVLEEWQRDGKPVDLSSEAGKIASAGLKFLPQPGTHATEYKFVFDTGRAVYHGLMDLRGEPTFPIQSIWDHKTTSSFDWMKTAEVLRKDPQANIYAMAVIYEAERLGLKLGAGFERIEQNWVYYLANPSSPKSRKVQLHIVRDENSRMPVRTTEVQKAHFGVMTLAELYERFEEIEATSQEILALYREKPKALDVTYNVTACSAFGGCPYKGTACVLSLKERIESMEAQTEAKTLTLAEKIRAKLAAGVAPAEPAAPQTPAAPAASAPAASAIAPPRVNPPEQPRSAPTGAVASMRAEISARAMQGLVSSRIFSVDDNRYAMKVTAEAVKLADALLAALGK